MTALHKKATGWSILENETNQKPETYLEIVYKSDNTDISQKAQNKKNRMEAHEKFMRHCYEIKINFQDHVNAAFTALNYPSYSKKCARHSPYQKSDDYKYECYRKVKEKTYWGIKHGISKTSMDPIDIAGKSAYNDSLQPKEKTVYKRYGLGGSLDYCIFSNADYAD